MRLRWGGIGFVLLGLLAGAGVLVAATPLGRYLARAGWEEMQILRARRPIEAYLRDPATDAVTRGKLELVVAARRYAVDSLGLPAGKVFTTYVALKRDTLVLVLSGVERDRLESVTWWFPVVGRLPYKGYFNLQEAQRAEKALQRSGRDTYLRPAAAFSTLGWFDDPLLSTTLRADSVDIANTVIHELTHNRYFAKGEAVFNESFANFVGARGAERFFRSRGDTVRARASVERWEDERRLGAFWAWMYGAIDSTFTAHPGDSARALRLSKRDSIGLVARRVLVDSIAPLLKTIPPAYAERVRLDNAALMARRIYLTDLEYFERVYAAEKEDLERAIRRIIAEAKSKERASP